MTIPARYENRVFKPLEDVKLAEGAELLKAGPSGPNREKGAAKAD